MNADQIAWARAVAEESYDGQLIRDLCNALQGAEEEIKLVNAELEALEAAQDKR